VPTPKRPSSPDLAALRKAIDAFDQRIIALLNRRSKLVVKVGKYKQAHGIPIYAPHREQEVLGRVLGHNQGPLPARTIEAIYRELMSGSFALEQPLKIGFLGPEGSFSHVAAVRHFGQSVQFENLREIAGVFTEVQRGHVDYGLVPIENSIHGGIAETLDAFVHSAGKVHVYAEVQLAIHHALMANCAPSRVKRIYSKPEVFSQCRTWLATQYPQAELVSVASSSKAVQMVAEESARLASDATSAAIGNAFAGELYGVNILFPRIEDDPNNITRFFVIARTPAQPSGDDKTSMMFRTLNKPGALVSVLDVFRRAKINLTHIDKRPGGRTNWQYTFFIDAQGHDREARFTKAIASARRHCQELWVLGSYPRSKRIL
jgi:chorismate mutase/prephenate dehydratase